MRDPISNSLRFKASTVLSNWLRCGLSLLGACALCACSGVQTQPDDTTGFADKKYTRYAWRSEPLTQAEDGYSKDKFTQADPTVRATIQERLKALGYREVSKDEAEFLVEYLAAAGFSAGRLATNTSNVTPYPTATINRQIDGASVDNAYALSGIKETGNLVLAFIDKGTTKVLWKVQISALIEDANRVDKDAVRNAVRQGLSTLPKAATR